MFLRFMRLLFFILVFSCSFVRTSFAQPVISYGDNPSAGKYINLNGVRHYYETYGNGTPLVLIHGNSTGIKGWAAQIEHFSRHYRVYAIDGRGRGHSDMGGDTLTYIQQAKDIAAFIRTMKLDSVFIVGKSDGGIIALLLGIYYPDHIQKIVAFGTNVSPDTSALFPQVVHEIRAKRLEADRMIKAGDTTHNWYLVEQLNRMMEFQPHITAADMRRIKVPVLVMSCDRDLIKLEHTMFIYNNIPRANLSILSGQTHSVPRLNPGLFNEVIDDFLSKSYRDETTRYQKH